MKRAHHDSDSGKPPRRLPRPRLLGLAALVLGAAGSAALVLVVVLQSSAPRVDPSAPAGYGLTPGPSRPSGLPEPGAMPPGAVGDGSPTETPTTVGPGTSADPRSQVPVASGLVDRLGDESPLIPVRLRIPALGIDAPIRPVGVAGGELEVLPEAGAVGWYRFGPAPGEPGSSVLAAHVAWRGERGVFYRLRDLPVDTTIEVEFEGGAVRRFRSAALASYDKDELPVEAVFRREGPPVLTLITCGGAVDPDLRRFEDNVVVIAVLEAPAFVGSVPR